MRFFMFRQDGMSVILRLDLEECLRMLAGRADLRRFFTDINMPAVAAFPAAGTGFDPHFILLNVGEQFLITLLVTFFDRGDPLEKAGDVIKTFGFRLLREVLVHLRPFLMFACGGRGKIFRSGTDAI